MSAAVDLYVLSKNEVAQVTSFDAVEGLGSPHVVLWGFTNFEAEDLASWLDVPGTEQQPILVDDDSGAVVFAWTAAFAEALARLSAAEVRDFAQRLKEKDELAPLELDTITENLKRLSETCSEACAAGKTIVQVASF